MNKLLSEQEKNDIKEIVKTMEFLAKSDPLSLILIKSKIDALKDRCDLEREMNR